MLLLAAPEAAYVASYLGRLRSWDAAAAVRLQGRGGVVGLYSAPAPDVLALVVVPLAERVTGSPLDGVDRVLSAGRLRDVLGTVSGDRLRELRLPDPVVGPAELSDLPPASGWVPGMVGVAGDLGAEPTRPDVPADGASGWGGLPSRVLRVAAGLGLLARPEVTVRASVAGRWSRLETPGGQVFGRSGSPNLLAARP